MDKEKILTKIKHMKHLRFSECCIPSFHNNSPYRLLLLTEDMKADKTIIQALADWRKAHAEAFSETFQITYEGTEKWYMKNLIDVPDRLLFFIEINNQYIGHVGLFRFDFDSSSCEVDNIIRGVAGGPGIMQQAIYDMMFWGVKELDIKDYTLQVASDNPKAVNLYKRLKFVVTKCEPLIKIITDGGYIKWIDAPEGEKDIKRYNLHMRLDDEKIFS